MLVKEYGLKKIEGLDEDKLKLNSSCVLDIIESKDKIIELLDKPRTTFCDEEIPFLEEVSVRHYGVVFDVISPSSKEKNITEYGLVYFFNNGEIHFVIDGYCSNEFGYQTRDDEVVDELDRRMDFEYKLIKEKMGVAEIYEKTKPRNRKMMENCKKKIDYVLTEAGKKELKIVESNSSKKDIKTLKLLK